MKIEHYLDWLARQQCIDCGARYADRPRNADGLFTDLWATENQCFNCLLENGAVERRGLPSAAEQYRDAGGEI